MLIHKLFEKCALENLDTIALTFQDQVLTYEELNKRSNQIANALQKAGVKAGDIVGICLERSPDLIAGVLGILKAGAAYLPLDPEYPLDRIQYMISHSKVSVILNHKKFEDKFSHSTAKKVCLDQIDLSAFSSSHCDVDEEKINLCYVIYTSGSTGNPKGVCLGHQALTNLINWQNKKTFKSSPITLQFTPLSFDVHFQEIFSTLTMGGKLILIEEELRINPAQLLNRIIATSVERLFLPFVALNQLADTATKINLYPDSLKEIITAGEQLKVTSSIREFFSKIKESKLHNHYGPSESHVVSSCTLDGDPSLWDSLPSIGRSIQNCTIHLLDEELKPVAVGSEGELYLSGVCLADGYLHSKELTNERFFLHPELGRLYKTGDIGYVRPDGDIQFLGRKDGQVKIRGYRIELGEIEIALQKNSLISLSAVKINEIQGENYICAYYVGEISTENIRIFLKTLLPEYMVPTHFISLSKLPLTPSGKVDYKALPKIGTKRPELMSTFVKPETDIEKVFSSAWCKYLVLDEVGINDNFFDLGGNSLLAIRIIVELNQALNKEVSVVAFFQAPTISQLISAFFSSEEELVDEFVKDDQFSADIAVIGLSGRFPGAENIEALWDNLIARKNSLEMFTSSEVDPIVPQNIKDDSNYVFVKGAFASQRSFDYKYFGMTPRESELMDPQQRKFLELSVEALESAGYYSDKSSEVIGIFAGMANSKYSKLVDQHPEKAASIGDFNVMLGLEKDYIATRVAHKLNLTGPALSIHTGCSTSLVSIIEAVKSIRSGDCTMALAGGISISGTPNLGHLFQEGGILSRDGLCKPFDENATGTIFTEGAGIVVLKRLDKAILSGDNILGVIKGVGINNDGSDKMSFTAPSMKGQARAIRMAHADAQIDPRTISYIEAHGTATPVGDPIEVEALKEAFRAKTKDKNFCYLSSVKANLGHLTAAAGVTGFIKALLVVNKGIIPGTANFETENKLLNLSNSPFIVTSENTQLEETTTPRRAGVSSFGVGGTNAHIVLEQYIAPAAIQNKSLKEPTLFKISAKTEEQLVQLEEKLRESLTVENIENWKKIAFTLEVGRKEFSYRKFLVLDSEEDLAKKVPPQGNSNHLASKMPLYMSFPGQGSQYLGMARELCRTSIIFKIEFDKCCEILNAITKYDIRDVIFSSIDDNSINDTYYTQPAIFIIEYALGKTLLEMGFKPSGFIGHSIGEYAAATLSGIFSLEDGLKIISKRAELIKALPSGSMLSVGATLTEVEKLICGFDVDIAAINAKNSVVVSGDDKSITLFKGFLEEQGIASVILKTSHAFHSRMMLPAVTEFKLFLDKIKKHKPLIPLLSTISLKESGEELLTSEYWANHILEPVRFEAAMKVLSERERGVCLEVGPSSVLTSLSKKISSNKAFHFIASLGNKEPLEASNLLKAIGALWTFGHDLTDGRLLYRREDQKRRIAPTYPFAINEVWLTNNKEVVKKDSGVSMQNIKKTEFSKKLVELFEASSGIDIAEFGNDTCFLEMGMDSLFLTQMALQLKKEFKIQINFRQLLEEYGSINALSNAFVDQVNIEVPQAVTTPAPTPQFIVEAPREQMQLQQRSVIPVAKVSNGLIGSNVEQIIQGQLDLMTQQLLLLQGANFSEVKTVIPNAVAPVETLAPKIETAPLVEAKKVAVRGADIKTAKDSFGAQAKINLEKNTKFSSEQSAKIKELFNTYIEKTKLSKEFTQENRKPHADPRVVTGFKPENKEIIYPVVVKKSKAQYLWDLDDNKYIDMLCGFGSNFFGNGNEHIKKYVLNQIEEGIEIGPQHPLTSEVSKLICDLTGNDRAAFCNTGSEAVLGAMRLARTVTGREKIVVFSGSYHGINDEVIIRASRDKSFPAAPGINGNAVSNMIVLDYGTPESLEIIRNMADELAAVLVEPVQSRRCNFHPVDFLKEVRKITTKSETCLIFDEVITGFRIHPAGAQGYFGIRADLCTYGKIVGGGMPIGVISGISEYMDALDGGHWEFGDDSTPTVGVTYFAGTFVRHPLALAAAKGALEILKNGGEELLSSLNTKATNFANEINSFCKKINVPFEMHNFGSLMKPKWTEDVLGGELLFTILRKNGVHTYDGFPWFINLAHTDADLQKVLTIIKQSIEELQAMGLLPNSKIINRFDAKNPPRLGAKLGRNEQGNPAWYIEDDSKPNEFFLIED